MEWNELSSHKQVLHSDWLLCVVLKPRLSSSKYIIIEFMSFFPLDSCLVECVQPSNTPKYQWNRTSRISVHNNPSLIAIPCILLHCLIIEYWTMLRESVPPLYSTTILFLAVRTARPDLHLTIFLICCKETWLAIVRALSSCSDFIL